MTQNKKSKQNQKLLKRPNQIDENSSFFFMAAALCIYGKVENDVETIRQRHINVLLEADTPQLRKADLNTMHRSAMQRLNAENGVTPDQIKDIVILNISLLGAMPPELFHGEPQQAVDGASA